MAYLALYRRWRPSRFDQVKGQDVIVTTLINQLKSGRIPHAYLFCGSRGTGKTSVAKLLARAVNCLSPVDGEPCGECTACQMLENETSLDVVEMDAASNNGVDEIRSLRENAQYPPQFGKKKVYIIDEVHMLSGSAFNALLKTLEEPPEHVVFILATTEPQKLPATILSRCQRYDFKRIPASVIAQQVTMVSESEGVPCDPAAASIIASAAEGGMRDALSILEMCLAGAEGRLTEEVAERVMGVSDRSFVRDFAQALLDGNAADACERVARVMREGRDPSVFAQQITGRMRALLLAKNLGAAAGEVLEMTPEHAADLSRQAEGADEMALSRMAGIMVQAEADMKWASSPRTVLELAVVRCCHPERDKSVEALTQRVAELEKALKNGVVVTAAPDGKAAGAGEKTAKAAPVKRVEPPASEAEGYDAALKLVRKNDISVYMSLKRGEFEGIQDGVAQIAFKEADGIHADMLSDETRASVVKTCLTEAFAREIKPRFFVRGEQKNQAAEGRKRLDRVFDVMDRSQVEVLDQL